MILIDYPAATIPDIAFTYDTPLLGVPANANRGHVARITDGIIDTSFGHEVAAAGSRTTATAAYPDGRSYTVVEQSDFEGNPTSLTYPSGREVLYDVDDDNRVIGITLKDGFVFTPLVSQIAYKPGGPISAMTFGDGASQGRTYDTSYRQTAVLDSNGATTHRDLTYGYEGRDNLTAVTDLLAPAQSEAFGYTPRESLSSASGPYGSLAFTYDGVGNRITHSVGAATDTYTYPPGSNRLGSISLATAGTRAFTYDAAGNTLNDTRGAGYSYTYDAAGRMASMSINGVLQGQYKYDFAGRQAIRTIVSTGQTVHSVFDSTGKRIAEYDQASGALLREYVWTGWEPVAVIENGVVYFVRVDHIGRPVFATNATGAKVWTVTYDPFGNITASTGAGVPIRFPGQWFQSESGLHQNWMRDYDPTTGRYLQADPLGLVDGASVYGYARQNPMRWVDPRGEAVLAISFQIDAYGFGGGSFSIGRYWEWGCECGEGIETGQFKTLRMGAGFGLGISFIVTFMPNGCKEDFFGASTSTAIAVGPFSGEGGWSSGGVGYGSGGVGIGLPLGVDHGNNTTTEIRF